MGMDHVYTGVPSRREARNLPRVSSPHTGKYKGYCLPLNCVRPIVKGVGVFVNVNMFVKLYEGKSLRERNGGNSLREMIKSGKDSSVW